MKRRSTRRGLAAAPDVIRSDARAVVDASDDLERARERTARARFERRANSRRGRGARVDGDEGLERASTSRIPVRLDAFQRLERKGAREGARERRRERIGVRERALATHGGE